MVPGAAEAAARAQLRVLFNWIGCLSGVIGSHNVGRWSQCAGTEGLFYVRRLTWRSGGLTAAANTNAIDLRAHRFLYGADQLLERERLGQERKLLALRQALGEGFLGVAGHEDDL